LKYILLFFIKCYVYFLNPFILSSCRFYPSCSNYSYFVVLKYGILKGSFLMIKRIIKCNPWCNGGYDPVP